MKPSPMKEHAADALYSPVIETLHDSSNGYHSTLTQPEGEDLEQAPTPAPKPKPKPNPIDPGNFPSFPTKMTDDEQTIPGYGYRVLSKCAAYTPGRPTQSWRHLRSIRYCLPYS